MLAIEYIIGIVVLFFASVQDFRTRMVSDTYSIVLFFTALLFTSSISVTLVEMIIVFTVSYIMFLFNWWGGADVKLMAGIVGILGINLMMTTYLRSLLIAGLVGSLFYLSWEYIKTKKINLRVTFPFVPAMFLAFVFVTML